MAKLFQFVLCASGILCLAVPQANALTDAELQQIQNGFETRRDQYLAEYLDKPFYDLDTSFEQLRKRLKSANWIWYPNENAATSAPVGARHFQREVSIPRGAVLQKSYVALAADNYCTLRVNGREAGKAGGFRQATLLEITRYLKPGENTVSINANNAGAEPNPAGVLAVIYIELDGAAPIELVTDATWRSARELPRPTNETNANHSIWTEAEVVGPTRRAPWKNVSLRFDVHVNQFVFSRLTFALAALHFQKDQGKANAAILEAVDEIRREHQTSGEFGLHWMGGVFYRIYGLFGPGGKHEGQLSDAAAEAIRRLFQDWARSHSRIAEADPELTWRLWGSENHSAQRDATRWAAARMIAQSPDRNSFRYDDGTTAQQQLKAWRIFLKRYFRERVARGMLVEISPSGYGSRTLQGWHNIYDFTDDPELKNLVKSALDVWWADWAQEQLDGMRGGGKTRLYPGAWALAGSDRNRAMSWFYLGRGKPAHHHETLPVIATTTYRLPLVVMDIALDPEGRGEYECRSRRLGKQKDFAVSKSLSKPGEPIYDVDSEFGGVVRYSYCTPDFVLGCLMFESRDNDYWTAISQQNRWHGAIFAGAENSTLYPRCDTNRSTYNAHWAIQNKGTLIVQKLRQAKEANAMRVCFSTDLQRHESDGWVFAKAARAFAAVKVVDGGWSWDDARWLRCDKEFTPIIIEVARSRDYDDDFDAFQQEINTRPIDFKDGVLRYQGLNESGDFTFFASSDRAPELNGEPIDLAPAYTYQSPFLNSDWASGLVRISKGNRELLIDVRDNASRNQ